MAQGKLAFDIDSKFVCEKIEKFIRNYVTESKTNGVVIGLSGGIDSAVVAALAVRALGKDKVHGFILPSATLDPSFEKDALTLAKQLGINVKIISIEDLVETFRTKIDKNMNEKQLIIGNVMARFRMIILYAYANYTNCLVIGTANKTETMVGYFTKHGDGGVDFSPCGDLYKTQIRMIAKFLDIPNQIRIKPPTAGLWPGQTDEKEMGVTYEQLDLTLLAFEKGYTKEQIIKELKIDTSIVEKIERMIKISEHKRKVPPVCKF